MKRNNHYEAAVEEFLRERRVAYVAVDESRRSLLGDESLKSLDFIIHGTCGVRWLVDVKVAAFRRACGSNTGKTGRLAMTS